MAPKVLHNRDSSVYFARVNSVYSSLGWVCGTTMCLVMADSALLTLCHLAVKALFQQHMETSLCNRCGHSNYGAVLSYGQLPDSF